VFYNLISTVIATGTSMSVLGRAMNLNTVQARRTGAWHGLSPHSDTRLSNSCRVQQCYGGLWNRWTWTGTGVYTNLETWTWFCLQKVMLRKSAQ